MEKTILRLSILLAVNMVLGLLLFYAFAPAYGWLTGNVIGLLFANFLAQHEFIYQLVRHWLIGSYAVCMVAGLDVLFALAIYVLLDAFCDKGGSWRDLFGVVCRALKYLLPMQVAVGLPVVLILWKVEHFSSINLIPPLLSGGVLDSLYMALWEMSLFFFVVGFALTEKWLGGLQKAKQMIVNHWKLWLIVFAVGMLITWLPGTLLHSASFPGAVWTVLGITLHMLFISVASIFLFTQPDTFEN